MKLAFVQRLKEMDAKDRANYWKEFSINNSLYFLIFLAVVYIQVKTGAFLQIGNLVNMLSLTAASLPIALGIAGTIVLTGTDLSAGRVVGLTACISASLLQPLKYANKMFPGLDEVGLGWVILLVLIVGAIVGLVNGFSVAKFSLHPFIVTLATQLIVYGFLLMYLQLGNNNGQSISGMSDTYKNFITGSWLRDTFGLKISIPNYIFYVILLTVLMWFIWNKTTFGKNMFAVGSNPQAAEVSGVNVHLTIIKVFVLAGMMYGITGFIEGARIGSNTAFTGQNYELDAIAACVIGGVSFVGGIGKISGIIIGVFLLRLIFTGLITLGINGNLQYVIKGLIILVACAIDMRKYLTRK